jgi:transmembrane sensor
MNDDTLHPDSLLNNDSFIHWVLYNKDAVVWNKMLNANPDQKKSIERARDLVLEMHAAEASLVCEIDIDSTWKRIQDSMEELEEKKSVHSWKSAYNGIKWALLTVCGIGFLFLIFNLLFKQPQVSYQDLVVKAKAVENVIEKENKSSIPLKFFLSDGSMVVLAPQSKLTYPQHFQESKREVILTGQAIFDIVKDSGKPFFVLANETVTKVLGTRFEVNAFERDKQITIRVISGRVSVYKQTKSSTLDPEMTGLVLGPNQKGTFNRDKDLLSKNLVAVPLPVVSMEHVALTRFDEVLVADIFQELERIYGIKILFDRELLSRCIVSTTIRNESLYDNLEVLCRTINSSYKEIDAQIVIESAGCF